MREREEEKVRGERREVGERRVEEEGRHQVPRGGGGGARPQRGVWIHGRSNLAEIQVAAV